MPVGKTLAMILAGGEGRRLAPLTQERSKPAVTFGGRYRIIDFVLSNFANSGVLRMKVLTQYKSESLNTHMSRGWRLSSMLGQFVESVPAQQRTGPEWYKGSADAIYQNLNLVTDEEPDYVFVFGADHIYRMDVRQMLDFHVAQKADCTVAAIPMPLEEGSSFGIITADERGRMVDFQEKPKHPFFFQAEDGIRDGRVTGVQTCALPIWSPSAGCGSPLGGAERGVQLHGERRERPD